VRLMVLLCAAATSAAAACAPPAWWGTAGQEDSYNWYFEGSGTSRVSADEALAEARLNALRQSVERIAAGCSEEVGEFLLGKAQGWEERDKFSCKQWTAFRAWSRIRYPKAELEALGTWTRDGAAQFETARSSFAGKQYEAAVSALDRLCAAYPVGKQPLFPTERAWLMASDCRVALGQPRGALAAAEAILNASADPAYRKEAEDRIAAIRADYTNLLHRGAFGGKRIAVRCALDVDGQRSSWTKMQTEVEKWIARVGGELGAGAALGGADLPALIGSKERGVAKMREIGADGILLVLAQGQIKQRANGDKTEVGFAGRVSVGILLADREPFVWEQQGPCGWNPLGIDMAMDMLALKILPFWQAEFTTQLEAQ